MWSEGEGFANHLLSPLDARLHGSCPWVRRRRRLEELPHAREPRRWILCQEMVQQCGPGPWQTNDDQRFPYRSLLDEGKALQILLDTQPVAEQPEALLADGKAAEQVQRGRALKCRHLIPPAPTCGEHE